MSYTTKADKLKSGSMHELVLQSIAGQFGVCGHLHFLQNPRAISADGLDAEHRLSHVQAAELGRKIEVCTTSPGARQVPARV